MVVRAGGAILSTLECRLRIEIVQARNVHNVYLPQKQ